MMNSEPQQSERPIVGLTMGDPAGVGPETIARAWSDPALHEAVQPTVVGHAEILRRAVRLVDAAVEVVEVSEIGERLPDPRTLPVLQACGDAVLDVPPATVDPRCGQAAHDAVSAACRLALNGQIDAITTAPLNKAALAAAGIPFPGHTELLGNLCGVDDVSMMLYLAPGVGVSGRVGLGVVHATLHTALRDVFEQLDERRIVNAIRQADAVFRRLLGDREDPRIGVCALNPHAGEQGLFGDEEREIIGPAVARARTLGVEVEGPCPADTLLVRAAAGQHDAIVAMYHDQGHIALKLLGMYRAVNITLGLPIVRTSVAHGTAFDLAWRGVAESSGIIEACRAAGRLASLGSGIVATR